jgi:hypothetical protein
MSMFSEIGASIDAERIGKILLEAAQDEDPIYREKLRKALMPLFDGRVKDAYGCASEIEEQVRAAWKDDST